MVLNKKDVPNELYAVCIVCCVCVMYCIECVASVNIWITIYPLRPPLLLWLFAYVYYSTVFLPYSPSFLMLRGGSCQAVGCTSLLKKANLKFFILIIDLRVTKTDIFLFVSLLYWNYDIGWDTDDENSTSSRHWNNLNITFRGSSTIYNVIQHNLVSPCVPKNKSTLRITAQSNARRIKKMLKLCPKSQKLPFQKWLECRGLHSTSV